jgi:hypothetical protein
VETVGTVEMETPVELPEPAEALTELLTLVDTEATVAMAALAVPVVAVPVAMADQLFVLHLLVHAPSAAHLYIIPARPDLRESVDLAEQR